MSHLKKSSQQSKERYFIPYFFSPEACDNQQPVRMTIFRSDHGPRV